MCSRQISREMLNFFCTVGHINMLNSILTRAGSDDEWRKDRFHANINVTDICNFKCSYCINSSVKDGKRVLPPKIIAEFIEDAASKQRSEYSFSMAGGEPLLYPHLEFLVKSIAQNIKTHEKRCVFVTNGSLLTKVGESLYRAASGRVKIGFSVSVHLEQIDIRNFVKNIVAFGHKEDIVCKILFSPGTLKETMSTLDSFATKGVRCIVNPVTYKNDGQPYPFSAEEINFLEKYNNIENALIFNEYRDEHGVLHQDDLDRIKKTMHPELLNYQGMWCTAGRNAVRLGPHGVLIRCFGAVKHGDYFDLSKRRMRDIQELAEPLICPATYCGCLSFQRLPKWLEPDDAPAYL